MRIYAPLLLGLAALVGCNDMTPTAGPVTRQTETETHTTETVETAPPARDNTAVNQRDRHTVAKTPIDQDENQADVNTTAEIRKQIVATPDMSINGQNVKVITSQGHVTLRGPVTTEEERTTIEKIAKSVAGDDKVDNQLEIAP